MTGNHHFRGMGLGGMVIINFVTLMSLIGTILFNGVKSRRGLLLLWLLGLVTMFLILFEIAHA
ncbi:MAG: hypothetical protein KKB37_10540 [Alphaproteobacteria bacterium]|nr:hypothetical protein [Alphaproteobacteria bacterium]